MGQASTGASPTAVAWGDALRRPQGPSYDYRDNRRHHRMGALGMVARWRPKSSGPLPAQPRRRGLRSVKLVIPDAHEGINALVFGCSMPSGNAAACTSSAVPWACRQERTQGWRNFHRHRLCLGNRRRGQGPMAQDCRSAPADRPEAREPHGRRRGGRSRLHDLPSPASH